MTKRKKQILVGRMASGDKQKTEAALGCGSAGARHGTSRRRAWSSMEAVCRIGDASGRKCGKPKGSAMAGQGGWWVLCWCSGVEVSARWKLPNGRALIGTRWWR